MNITLEQSARARLITLADPAFPVPTTLRYDSGDPLAISMDFPSEVSLNGADVTWTFARDLLWEGLAAVVGEGDVHVWPCGRSMTMVELHGTDGLALLEFETNVLCAFLMRTYGVVAVGREEVGPAVDSCLSALMGGV